MKTRNTEELLKRIRRGTTDTFSVQDWLACLDTIGWRWIKEVTNRVPRYTITTPGGETFRLEKEPGYRVITFYNFRRWALAHGLLAAVEAKVGPEPVKPVRDDLENTGICPCCFGTFKLKPSVNGYLGVVLHGYKRPGYGYTVGSCFGVGYAPYEVNCIGTERFLEVVVRYLADVQARIERLKAKPETIAIADYRGEVKTFTQADGFEYTQALARLIFEATREERQAQADNKFLQDKIDTWAPAPLYGSKKGVDSDAVA